MTWIEFTSAVDSHLAVESTRRGMEAFRARYIRNAIMDLQRYIRGFREGNSSVYGPDGVTDHGQAQLVQMPDGCIPKALYIYSVDTELNAPLCYRYRLQFYPWNSRQDMICGRLNFNTWLGGCCYGAGCPTPALVPTADQQYAWFSKAYVYTIGPMGRNFLIYPKLTESTRLLLVYDGMKYTFGANDVVPFPEVASEAVAAYVQAKITRNVDKNIPLSREFEQDWVRQRLSLFRDFNEKFDLDQQDEEYDANYVNPSVTNFSAFDAQSLPFLRTITAIAGSGANALEQVPTVGLDVPTSVLLLIGGVIQLWVLEASTDPTGPGRQRGADYTALDPKSWVQLS